MPNLYHTDDLGYCWRGSTHREWPGCSLDGYLKFLDSGIGAAWVLAGGWEAGLSGGLNAYPLVGPARWLGWEIFWFLLGLSSFGFGHYDDGHASCRILRPWHSCKLDGLIHDLVGPDLCSYL